MANNSTVKRFKFNSILILVFLGLVSVYAKPLDNKSDVRINIKGLKNSKGFISLVVYDNAKDFPGNDKYYKLYKLKPANNKSSLLIKNLPFGTYAVALMHDENANNKFDTNLLGIPKEGFGFSQNPAVVFKEPSFNECKFQVNTAVKNINIKLKYF